MHEWNGQFETWFVLCFRRYLIRIKWLVSSLKLGKWK
jgi:hypothetical protein